MEDTRSAFAVNKAAKGRQLSWLVRRSYLVPDGGVEHPHDAFDDRVQLIETKLYRGRLFAFQQLQVKQIVDNPRLQ